MTEHLGDQLSALLDGDLDDAAVEAVYAHLALCPACAGELRTITATRALLRDLPVVDAPSGFYEVMLARHRRRIPLGIAALAVAAAVAFGVAAMPDRSGTVKPAIPPMVQTHAVSASLFDDPVAQLTAVAVPTTIPPAQEAP